MKLNSVRSDLNAVEDGIFFQLSEDGAAIKIAKWNNTSHAAFLRDLFKTHGKKIQHGAITNEGAELLLAGQWVHIVKDWKGITEDDGKTPVQFSQKTLIDLASNPQYKDFFNQIEAISKDVENYRVQNVKMLGEDSPSSSDGQ